MSEQEEESVDPFGPVAAPGLSLIMQFRIYDVLMALLKEQNPETARELLELHLRGGIGGASPDFTGVFLTNELNPEVGP